MTSIHYIFHSCYVAEDEQCMLVFDYWKDPEQRLKNLLRNNEKRLYFVVSHFHEDHFNSAIFNYSGARFLISYDTVKRRRLDPSSVTSVLRPGHGFSDDLIRVECFRSSDIGVCSSVTMSDGTICFHMGDCNNWYFPEDKGEQLKISPIQMEKLFLSIVREVAEVHPHVDHLMFPVDPRLGAHATRGLDQWLSRISASHIYAMHCWQRYDEVCSLLSGRPHCHVGPFNNI